MKGQAEFAGVRASHRKQALLCVAAGKLLLMAGAAAVTLCALPTTTLAAAAKTKPAAAPPADDGLGPRDIYMEADTVADNRAQHTVTATGHVEARYQGRTLRADSVTYDTVTGVTHAIGHVTIVNADGSIEYSKDTELDDQFRAAVAIGFSARLQDNVTMVAGAAIRRNDTTAELNHGLYTPCSICKADGKTPKKPTFSIQATRIVQDHEHQVIYYRNAIIRVFGIPVFASPVFWHADPTAKRSSGLLTPKIDYSKRRGASYTQPYYWTISPYADLTVSPQFNTAVRPFLGLRYREQFYSGAIDIRTGYTYEQEFDSHTKFGDDTSRSYILAKGTFQLDPKWTVGFGAERVTDPTLFQRYSVGQIYTDRGPFPTDTDRLISQLYANRVDSQSYFSVAALSFQSLRAAVVDNGVTVGTQSFDSGQAFPTVTPVVEEHYDPSQPILGGRLRLTGSAVALTRNNPVISIIDPTGVLAAGPQPYSYRGDVTFINSAGLPAPPPSTASDPVSSLIYRDSRRASGEANWQTDFILNNGIRIQPFADARFDYFSIDRGELENAGSSSLVAANANDTRGLGTVGANLSWPFIRPIGKGSLVIEPLAQFVFANRVKLDPNIPNEDSVSFEFDETNLFSINRFSGYDLAEGGARANLGARATLDLTGGRSASFLIGRTFRSQPDDAFLPQSGLRGTSSDWVTAASVTPFTGLSLFNRARFDGDDWTVRREEAGANIGFGRLSASVRYAYEQSGLVQVDCTADQITVSGDCPSPFGGAPVLAGSSVIGKVENAEVNGSWFFLKNWGVTINATHDFVGFETNGRFKPVWPVAQFGLVYLDDCIRFDLIYTHDETYSATIGPSNSIGFRLTLTTLGGTLNPANRTAREGSR